MIRTVIIHQAFIRLALHIWVTLVVFGAIAVGPMVLWHTNSIDSTFLKQARILAFSADACFIIRTFKVILTPS